MTMTQPLAPPLPVSPARTEQARRAVSTIFLLNGVLFATWAVNIPGVRDALHLTQGQIGIALLCFGLGSLFTMPQAGGWIARWGSDRVTHFAVISTMLMLALPFFMPNLWALAITLAILGAANGLLDVSMNAQGVTVEKALKKPIMSRLHAYFSLGSVLGAAIGTLLIGRVPMLTHVLLVTAVTTLLGYLAGRLLIPDPQHSESHQAQAQTGSPSSSPRISPAVMLLGALCFLGMLAEGANYDWTALYFRDVLHVAGGNAGIGYTAFVTCMTLGRWFGDRFRARFGDEAMVRGGAALTTLGLALALLVRDPLPAVIGFALSGIGLSNVVPVMYGTAGHALAGRGIAQVATIGYCGFLLGPPAIGFVAQHAGLPAALGIALLGSLLIVLLGGRAFGLVRQNTHPE